MLFWTSLHPTTSDGELVGSERYFGQFAHDPDSVDVENCTIPVLSHAMLGDDMQCAREQRVWDASFATR